MTFKLVISDPKSRKAYQKEVEVDSFLGKKLGDKVPGDLVGLSGYELEITGGSDKDGFPMRKDVEGPAKKKILITPGVGFKSKVKGIRKRRSVRGNTISKAISQINTKVIKAGSKSLEDLLGKKEEKPKEITEEKTESKEQSKTEEKKESSKEEETKAEKNSDKEPKEKKTEEKPSEEKPKKESKDEKLSEKSKTEEKKE